MQQPRKQKQSVTAIIYDKRGRVLSVGKNSYVKTHPKQAYYAEKAGLPDKQYLHAEIDAIIRCRDLANAHSIFVSRINKAGKTAMAKPCPVCRTALEEAGIFNVRWTT